MASFSWDDIDPLPQDDGPNPVAQIAYAEDFVKSMDLFRAVLFKGEHSLRVLHLTKELLQLNASNYTVWVYRRECLARLNSDLNEELDFMDSFAEDNPKNYQIWNHRRAVVAMLGDASRELAFCSLVFDEDSKNYHAWAHRQWAIETYGLWDGELQFIEGLLEADIRNNSAWNQRWFYVHKRPALPTTAELHTEVLFALDALRKVRLNESVWSYLRGLAKAHPVELLAQIYSSVTELVRSVDINNPFALGLLVDLSEIVSTEPSLKLALECCERLCDLDKIRSKSWSRRFGKLQLLYSAVNEVKSCV